jgi:uncharacterized protein (DUF1330 family)
MKAPAFLVVELAGEHANQVRVLGDAARLVQQRGGAVFAYAPPGRVACLEPGTVASGLLIARFTDRSRATAVARDELLPHLQRHLPAALTPLVLIADSLPDEGLPTMPDIPTSASVPRPPNGGSNYFLLVRGTAWDQGRLDAYRDVILPMHFERGGYYEAFAIAPGQVEAISGAWTEAIFAISRWPAHAKAEDFWFSDRYQQEAIPLRLGAGRFTVHGLAAGGAP